MTRTTDTAAGGLHCGSRARRYPRASKTTAGQTWFADGDTRVDNTEPGDRPDASAVPRHLLIDGEWAYPT